MGTTTSNPAMRTGAASRGGWLLAMLASVALTTAVRAQTAASSDVLTGSQVTEENLLEALSPDGVQKRSLRVKATGAGTSARPARASASLLITFHTNSSALTTTARQQLDVVGTALKNTRLAPFKFTVEGHADPRGDRTANLVLSQQRAASVKSYLVDAHGIDSARLTPEGKGDRELLNPQVPAAPENRRVTIVTQLQ